MGLETNKVGRRYLQSHEVRKSMKSDLSRRDVLKSAAMGAAVLSVPHHLLGLAAIDPLKPIQAPVADELQFLSAGSTLLHGFMHAKIMQQIDLRFNPEDLDAMADMFRKRQGNFADGELWGKAVRAMVKAYRYQRDPQLKTDLQATVRAILATQTADGCISSFPYEKQPYNADLWCRKYVLLGLEDYYSFVDRDPKVFDAMTRLADYTLGQVGPVPKVRIVDTGWKFEGIESSSILEPMVKLYLITGFSRYLDFARYIVEVEGGCKRESIFEAALKKDVRDIGSNGNPAQSIAKTYEMTSCFEGLVEYFRATANSHWKDSDLDFYHSVSTTETTVAGAGGGLGDYNRGVAPNEQWNDSTRQQIHPVLSGIEGCTGPRWIGLCGQLLRLTADPEYVDKIECALENVVLGSIKPDGTRVDYHTQLNGTRNNKIGFSVPINGMGITCCVYNVAEALTYVPMFQVMNSAKGPVVNLFFDGETIAPLDNGKQVHLRVESDYPKSGSVKITVSPDASADFTLRIRIPEWSEKTILKVNNKTIKAIPKTYAAIHRIWSAGDVIHLELDMKCHVVHPPEGSTKEGERYFALKRGPVVLVRDLRLDGDVQTPVSLGRTLPNTVELTAVKETVSAQMEFLVSVKQGLPFHVIDFASAGATWDKASEYRTWILAT